MAERGITTHGDGPEAALDIELHKLFVSELLAPSRPFWIVSAWLSDIEVIDNRGAELIELAPDLPVRTLRLVELLEHQIDAGATVHVIVREHVYNRAVMRRLEAIRLRSSAGTIRTLQRPDVHEKILLTDRLKVSGSMNLTHNGRLRNSETVQFTDDADAIERQRLDLEHRYGVLLE